MTQSKIILSVLNESPGEWFHSYDLCQKWTKYGFIGLAGPRRARELAANGEIEVDNSKKYAMYRVPPLFGQESLNL